MSSFLGLDAACSVAAAMQLLLNCRRCTQLTSHKEFWFMRRCCDTQQELWLWRASVFVAQLADAALGAGGICRRACYRFGQVDEYFAESLSRVRLAMSPVPPIMRWPGCMLVTTTHEWPAIRTWSVRIHRDWNAEPVWIWLHLLLLVFIWCCSCGCVAAVESAGSVLKVASKLSPMLF